MRLQRIATDCSQRFFPDEPPDGSRSPRSFLRVLWIYRLNAHSFDVRNHDGLSALFETGSKLTHSCTPNTLYQSTNALGEHRAVADIKKGDLLTTSYIDDKARSLKAISLSS